MTILSKLYSVAFKNYSYKAKNWRTVLPCNAKKNSDPFFAGCVAYPFLVCGFEQRRIETSCTVCSAAFASTRVRVKILNSETGDNLSIQGID